MQNNKLHFIISTDIRMLNEWDYVLGMYYCRRAHINKTILLLFDEEEYLISQN